LGRKSVKTDSRTLQIGDYMGDKLPAPPKSVDWTKGITNWGVMLNDQLGDCTIAGAAHAIQVWTAENGKCVRLPNAVIEQYYERWDGYKPGDKSTDCGGVELDVLNRWKKEGMAGHRLYAFADPKVKNLREIRQSIALFGGVYISLDLPLTAQKQKVWDARANPGEKAKKGSWGGHCVFVPAYDAESFTCVTWGELKKMTVAFWKAYCDEAHVLLSHDWVTAKGSPAGFDLKQLEADLGLIR